MNSFDDDLFGDVLGAATDNKPGKFKPKPRGKAVKLASSKLPPSNADKETVLDVESLTSTDRKLVKPNAVPGDLESVGASIPGANSSTVDASSSEFNVTQESDDVAGKTTIHEGISEGGFDVSGHVANLEAHLGKSDTEDMGFLDDLFQSNATADRAAGKFRPKLQPKIKKSIPTFPNPDATQISSPTLGAHASDVKFAEKGSSFSTSSTAAAGLHATQEHVNDLEDLLLNVDDQEALHGNHGKIEEAAEIAGIVDSLDNIQHDSTIDILESAADLNLRSSSVDFVSEFNETLDPLNLAVKSMTCEEACADDLQVTQGTGDLQATHDMLEEEASTDLSGREFADDIFLQSSSIAVKQLGKFESKLVPRAKDRKAKSVSFLLPDAAEAEPHVEMQSKVSACYPTEPDPSSLQMTSEGNFDIIESSGIEFEMDDGEPAKEDAAEFSGLESIDDILLQSTSTRDRPVGKFRPKPCARSKHSSSNASMDSNGATGNQGDSVSLGNEMDGQDLNLPAEALPDSVTAWDSNCIPTDLAQEQTDLVETSTLEAAFPGSDDLPTPYQTLGRNVPTDADHGLQSENFEELSQQILDERYPSKTVEDGEFSKSSRKLRKKINLCSPSELDGGPNEDCNVENSNVSQMDEDDSNDEYRGKETPKEKRAPRKRKGQMTENQKPVQKGTKTSEEPGSTEMTENQKPVQKRKKSSKEPGSTEHKSPKKKFPHGTKRKKRRVDKVLLETLEHETNPMQMKIKHLLMRAEANERISSKEAPVLGNSQSNNSSFPSDGYYDEDNPYGEDQYAYHDDEESQHQSMLVTSTKLNYHSYMNRPKSGRWSKAETEKLYQAIRSFGTDFAMIQQLFPDRTRHQVKLKYKNEERKHPLEVADALVHRSKDHTLPQMVMKQLQAQEEQNTKEDSNENPTTVSQEPPDGHEEQGFMPEKEEEEYNGFKDEADDYGKYDNWEGDVESAPYYNGYEDAYDDKGGFSYYDEY